MESKYEYWGVRVRPQDLQIRKEMYRTNCFLLNNKFPSHTITISEVTRMTAGPLSNQGLNGYFLIKEKQTERAHLGRQKSCQVDLWDHLAAAIALLLVPVFVVLHQVPNLDAALQVRSDHGGARAQAVWASGVFDHVLCGQSSFTKCLKRHCQKTSKHWFITDWGAAHHEDLISATCWKKHHGEAASEEQMEK